MKRGKHVIAGCGELHLEIYLKDFRDEHAQCDHTMGDPMVSYRETVAGTSSQTGPSKSPNKRSGFYLVVDLLPVVLSNTIESGKGGAKTDSKERAKIRKERFNRDENAARVFVATVLKRRVPRWSSFQPRMCNVSSRSRST